MWEYWRVGRGCVLLFRVTIACITLEPNPVLDGLYNILHIREHHEGVFNLSSCVPGRVLLRRLSVIITTVYPQRTGPLQQIADSSPPPHFAGSLGSLLPHNFSSFCCRHSMRLERIAAVFQDRLPRIASIFTFAVMGRGKRVRTARAESRLVYFSSH